MGLIGAADTSQLLSCFFGACETRFDFLTREHGFVSFGGLSSYEKGRQIIRPFHGFESPPHDFTAIMRFEKNDDAIELVFEGRDYSLAGFSLYNRIDRLAFSDMAMDDEALLERRGLHSRAQVEGQIERLAEAFHRHAGLLTAPDPELIERARARRTRRTNEDIHAKFLYNMEYAARQAARAYTEKDHRRVVELLAIFEGHLDPVSRKRLEAARRALIS